VPSRSRLEGAVRLARAYVDSDRATFAERELAWGLLQIARETGVGKEAKEGKRLSAPAEGVISTP
jgi:hypothetical protein